MSSHNNNPASANDPRQPSASKPFLAPMVSPQDVPVDYSGFVAVILGVAGVMFRFAIMGLVTNYLGPARPASQS